MSGVPFFLAASVYAALSPIDLPGLSGTAPRPGAEISTTLDSLAGKPYRALALVFLSPDCPLSRNIVSSMNALSRDPENGVEILGVVPRLPSGSPELREFRDAQKVLFPLKGDPALRIARLLGASVTPEAFLFDSAATRLYQGAVDDRSPSLGKKRPRAARNHLENAVAHWRRGDSVSIPRTVPVGCFIE